MNEQKIVKMGYYLHYKNQVYRIIDFAIKDDETNQKTVLYQPQYDTPGYGPLLLWSKPIDLFFKDIVQNEQTMPRFRYIGVTEERAKNYLNENKITVSPEPIFKEDSMLDQSIGDLVFGHYAIQAFAIDSDAEDNDPSRTRIIYNKNGFNKLMILPEKEFFAMSKINPDNKIIAKYLREIKSP